MRLTQSESVRLRIAADAAGQPVAVFVRERALADLPELSPDDDDEAPPAG